MPVLEDLTEAPVAEVVRPFMARWLESSVGPHASTDMRNPDTSTYNKSTEDNDT